MCDFDTCSKSYDRLMAMRRILLSENGLIEQIKSATCQMGKKHST
jgi:hypothetical protein